MAIELMVAGDVNDRYVGKMARRPFNAAHTNTDVAGENNLSSDVGGIDVLNNAAIDDPVDLVAVEAGPLLLRDGQPAFAPETRLCRLTASPQASSQKRSNFKRR